MNILTVIKYIEKVIIGTLVIILAMILLLSTADVAFSIGTEVLKSPTLLVEAENLMNIFSSMLIVIIGLELLETIKAYLKEDVVHVELVVLVAIIALGRKVIIWDFNKYSINEMMGLSLLLVSLAIVYFLIRKTDAQHNSNRKRGRSFFRTKTQIKETPE
jgi:uncharacterized membrane protein (DUF373 family)